MIKTEELNLLALLYDKKSLREASKELGVRDASIKKAIDSLESSLSLSLLSFRDDDVIFTESGKELAKDADFIIKYINRAVLNAEMKEAESAMALRVGVSLLSPEKELYAALEEKKEALSPIKISKVHFYSLSEELKHLESHIDILSTHYDDRLLKKYALSAIEIRKEKVSIALSKESELNSVPLLDIEDLYGKRLYLYKKGYLKAFDQIRADVKEYHKEIEIVSYDSLTKDLEKRIEDEGAFLATFKSNKESFSALSIKSVLWNYSSSFGILYRATPNGKVKRAIDALKI